MLRSPWWASLLVAVAIALAAFAVLPLQYAVFGALGALPFVVVCAIAAWRQWRAPSARHVQATLAAVNGMPWRTFASTLERAYQQDGYTVQRLPGP
ncbi:MAG TPA: restriction endonuclease, partial [Burkholderiaceae bacterium]